MENKTGDQYNRKHTTWSHLRQALVLSLSSFCLILLTSQVSTTEHLSGMYLGQDVPGNEPVRFARNIIPDDLHSVPVFSADGKSVYYKCMDGKGIMVAWDNGNKWTSPKPLFLNEEVENSDDPCLSPSGDKLFFSSYNKAENRDYIFFCDLNQNKIGEPNHPAGLVNELDMHWQFSIAENGNIYFASNGNIFCSEMKNGAYREAYRLEGTINSDLSECTPYISPNEDLLLFARSVNGKPDLFMSKKDNKGKWLEAVPLDQQVNTEHHEMCPWISADGKYLFFISSREGLFSAYWVDAGVLAGI